ncbi:Uu.00g085250.m01.CDS01 [Anthostomella pinea]|uniref:Uu.00g085250.m01.CDS01 n=1 Tax=Anthostomella pinea TaxID=933095 RepID=A0AAI8VLY1_9PEZI|nr:Uu.00g085250.m01.CDS01 [Anthostomella pinea]
MGQNLGRQAQPPYAPPRQPDSQEASLLLQLPADIFVLISQHLCPAGRMSLALTSKAAFNFLYEEARADLRLSHWPTLLPLLERLVGVGDQLYYCQFCNILHPFAVSTHPGPPSRSRSQNQTQPPSRCKNRQSFSPGSGSGYVIAYHHVRLAMNQHFYGAPCGIPLHQFERTHAVRSGAARWAQEWTARVVDHELLLCCAHTLTQGRETARAFRDAVNTGVYDICHHVGVHRGAQLQITFPKVAHHQGFELSDITSGQQRMQTVQGSCDVCLTDYQTTIAWREQGSGKSGAVWSLAITSYHQLGSCRSPYDPKWQAFAVERSRSRAVGRNQTLHPSGIIKDRWEAYEP